MAAKKKIAPKRAKAKPAAPASSGFRLVLSTALRHAINMAAVAATSGAVLLGLFAAKHFA